MDNILSLCLCLIPIEDDFVTLKQLDTRVGKGCIVPKNLGSFSYEDATIMFTHSHQCYKWDTPTMDYGFYSMSELAMKTCEFQQTIVYKNKKPKKTSGGRIITPIGSYNRIGYNPQSIGYSLVLRKPEYSEDEKIKVKVHKPSSTIRAYTGNVDYYTFGTKIKYKGVDLYYAYDHGYERECLVFSFLKDNVAYYFNVELYNSSTETMRADAQEALDLYL